jgi:LmbE family N-acetylglucosaminyl deacetylase
MVYNESLIRGKLLFIGAHPDDIEIGCGGTAAKYAARGHTIAFAIATEDKKDVLKGKKREREARKAAKLLSLSEQAGTLFFGHLADRRLTQTQPELRDWLNSISHTFKPNTVFFHRNDDHTDHQAVYKVAIGVFQRQNVLLYYIPRPFPERAFKPNCAVNVSDYIADKVAMCRCHATQEPQYVSRDSVRTNSHYFYQRSYGTSDWKVDGYAEGYFIYASRADTSKRSESGRGAMADELRLVKKEDGTFQWVD